MDEPTPSLPPPPNTAGGGCFKWLCITFMVVSVIAAFTFLRACQNTMTGLKEAAGAIAGLPGKFQSQNITDVFRENVRLITPTHGDILEVATAEREETLTRYDMKTALFNTVYLGTTISEIRVPAVYRYHVKLSDDWKLTSRGNTCVVVAPIIRPSLPPAIRTDKLESKTTAGWARFNAADNLTQLHKEVTPMLSQRASSPSHITEVRDASRKAVAEFVKTWLIKEDQWKEKGFTSIVVVFADEATAKDDAQLGQQPSTLQLVP